MNSNQPRRNTRASDDYDSESDDDDGELDKMDNAWIVLPKGTTIKEEIELQNTDDTATKCPLLETLVQLDSC
jgi:hypothetical protein